MVRRLDIDAMRALCAIERHGGVTRAARELALTQSAVSHKIRRLEESLGRSVLSRQPGKPLLNEEGRQLLGYARRILALHDEALASLGRQDIRGKIRLGMTEDVTSSDLSHILGRFTRQYPDIVVRTHVRQSLVLDEELAAGDIDVGIMQVFRHKVRSDDQYLFEEPIHWVKARDMQLPNEGALPFLAYDDQCFFKVWAMTECELPQRGLETVLQCASSAGIVSAVRAGLGITLLPHQYLTADMDIIDDCLPPAPDIVYVVRLGPQVSRAPVRALARTIGEKALWQTASKAPVNAV